MDQREQILVVEIIRQQHAGCGIDRQPVDNRPRAEAVIARSPGRSAVDASPHAVVHGIDDAGVRGSTTTGQVSPMPPDGTLIGIHWSPPSMLLNRPPKVVP